MAKLMEFICGGNCGRSAPAELIARNYFQDHNLGGFDSISSGTEVKYIEMVASGAIPLPDFVARWGVGLGFQRSLYSRDKAARLESILAKKEENYTPDETKFFLGIASDTLYIFELEEKTNREKALLRFNIRGPFKPNPEQTVKGSDRVVILGMGPKIVESTRKLYPSAPQCPVIDTLLGYSTGRSDLEIPDGFGRTEAKYLAMVDEMREHVLRSVAKMVAEHSR